MAGEYIPVLQNPDGSTVATPSDSSHASFFVGTNNQLYLKLFDGSVVLFSSTGGITPALYKLTPPVVVANTTTETTIATYTLPAGFFSVGAMVRVMAFGFYSAAATPTIRVRIYYGATVLLDTTAASANNATNGFTQLRAMITCTSTGATGTVWSEGYYQQTPAGSVADYPMLNTSAVTIDTTTANALKVTLQWGTASASNTATWTNLVYEGM